MNHDEQESEGTEENLQYSDEDQDISPESPLARKSAVKEKGAPPVTNNVPQKRTSDAAFSSEQEDPVMSDLTGTRNADKERKRHSLPDQKGELNGTDEEDYVDDGDGDDDEYDEDWKPQRNSSSRAGTSKRSTSGNKKESISAKSPKNSKKSRVPKLERDMEELSLKDDTGEDTVESAIILPKKSTRIKKIIIDSDSEEEQNCAGGEEKDEVPPIPLVKKKR